MAKQVTLTDINTGDIIYPISTIDSIFDQYNNSVKTLLNNVSNKISTVYIPSGSSTFVNLPTPSKDLIGHVYNVTDAFTTTSSFLEGSGKTYPAGTNVVIILNNESYLYDVLAGFIDLSLYRLKTDTTDSITEGSTNLYFTNARALSATSGTYLPISGNAVSATKLNTARTIGLSGGATGTATSFDGSANITIPVTSLDATKLSGTASINTTGNAATAATATSATKATQDASGNVITSTYATKTEVSTADATLQTNIDAKQDTLVSATNIKTINNTSLLGSGNITISAGASDWASITNKPFNYTTFSSQPTYFWGTNDGTTYQVYGTSNLNVNSSNYAYGLSSTRKLWGQSFDGTGDVNGTISNCDRIYNQVNGSNGDLYLGNSGNSGHVYTQDIASQSGTSYWTISQSGIATFSNQVTGSKFINSNSSDSYVLLGGGGTLALTKAGTTSGVFGGIPVIGSDGVMETGRYLDFHYSNSSTNDYAVRLSCNNDNNVVVYLPSSSGTLALTSAIPTNTTQLTNGSGYITSSALSGYATTSALSSYLPLSGGNMTGTINFYTNGTNCGSIYTNIVSGVYKMYVGTNCDQLYLYSQTNIYANSDLTLDSSSLYITGSGALNVAGASTLTGAVTCSSSITATSFYQSSDKDLKENIKSIANDDTTKLNDIEFKQFNFKSDESKTKHYGVIAQDVVNAGLDNLVSKNDKEELSVDYVSLLVLKIQQLEDRIKQLEDKINGSNSN